MKIALVGDMHYGIRNDNQAFHEYTGNFLKNHFFPYLKKNNINTIIQLGDFFDRRKYVNFLTAEAAKKQFLEPIEKNNMKLFMILGNHDVYYKNTNKLNSVETIFFEYIKNGTLHLIQTKPEEIDFDGVKFLFLPWICSENYDISMKYINESRSKICVGHLELNGFEIISGVKMKHGLDRSLFNKFDMVFSGHYHHKQSSGNIHYLGSFGQYTWSDFNDPRGFHIFDTETLELEFYQNPENMFVHHIYNDADKEINDIINEIYEDEIKNKYVKVIIEEKNDPYVFNMCVEKIEEYQPLSLQIIETFDIIQEDANDIINNVDDTKTIIEKYVDNMKIKVDKESIKKEFNSLFKEALNK